MGEPPCLGVAVALEPAGHGASALAERRLLQRLEGGEAAAAGMHAIARLRQRLAQAVDARARRSDLLLDAPERRLRLARLALQARDRLAQALGLVGGGRRRTRALELARGTLAPLLQARHVALQVLDARGLDLRRLRGLRLLGAEGLPARAPALERSLRLGPRARGGLGLRGELAHRGLARRERLARGPGATALGFELLRQRLQRRARLLQLALAPRAQLALVLDALLDAADPARGLVVALLHGRERLLGLAVGGAARFELGLHAPLARERRLHRGLGLAHACGGLRVLGLERAQAQREELRAHALGLGPELAVALGGARLALQLLQLLLHLLAQVVEPLEVLARVADAVLGLAPALLVLGDAGRLLDEDAQLVGLGLYELADHALLDDGVAARAEASAEEDVDHVAPPAARAVEEVLRLAVTAHHPPDGDLGVLGVGAAEPALAVVEDELHRCLGDRLARARAREDDVGHGVAAQVPGGGLAHHPAHGVDHVRLAAAVGADDPHERARELDGGGVHEGLEPRKPNLLQAHGRER